MTYVMI